MIVLDASVLIGYLDSGDAQHSRAVDLLERAADDDLLVATLTLAETLVGPVRAGTTARVLDALADLEVAEVRFGDGAAVRLATLRAETSLRMPDCCVLLAAEERQARVATFDDRLAAAADQRGIAALTT